MNVSCHRDVMLCNVVHAQLRSVLYARSLSEETFDTVAMRTRDIVMRLVNEQSNGRMDMQYTIMMIYIHGSG